MAHKQAYQAYSVAIQTIPKTKQVVMLYDGIMRFLKQAKTAIGEKRVEDRFNLLLKTSRIIGGLQSCLDFDHSEEVTRMSHILHRFYAGMNVRVLSINFQRDLVEAQRQCDILINEIRGMYDVWNHIDRTHGSEGVAETSALPQISTASVPAQTNDNRVTFSA